MGFGQSIAHVVRNSFNWSGRAQRSEFWWWALLVNIVTIAAYFADQQMNTPFFWLITLLVMFPNLGVEVRRLHDTDSSGWFVLISFIPILGGIILMLWFMQKGSDGPNQYGPDPLQEPQQRSEGASLA